MVIFGREDEISLVAKKILMKKTRKEKYSKTILLNVKKVLIQFN